MNLNFHRLIFTFALLTNALGQQFNSEILAVSGGMVGDDPNVRFGEVGPVSINNNGDLCFPGTIVDQETEKPAILSFVGGQTNIVAVEGDELPIFIEPSGQLVRGTRIASFGDPVISRLGRVAFLASLEVNTINVSGRNKQIVAITNDSDDLWVVDRSARNVQTGDQQFSNTHHKRLRDPRFDRHGRLTYRSLTEREGADGSLIYQNRVYRVDEFVSSGRSVMLHSPIAVAPEFTQVDGQLPSDMGSLVSAETPSTDDFRSIIHGSSGDRFVTLNGASEIVHLKTGDEIADMPGYVVTAIRGLSENPGTSPPVWVKVKGEDNERTGLVRKNLEGNLELLAASGDRVPGTESGVRYTGFELPVSAYNDNLAFIGHTTDRTGNVGQVLCRKTVDGVPPRVIAKRDQQVPGAPNGVTFRSFSSPQINQLGQVVFGASLSYGKGITQENDFAYFMAEPNREVLRILGKGDLFFFGWLDVRRIKDLVVSDLTEAGEIALTLLGRENSAALVKFSVPPSSLSTYDDWAATEIPDNRQRSFELDPDRDGLTNILEYAFGTDPKDAKSVSQPKLVLLDPRSARQLAIEFTRFKANSDINYIVEFSSDLENWKQASELIESVSANEDLDKHETVVVFQEPGWAPKDKFVRVRIEY